MDNPEAKNEKSKKVRLELKPNLAGFTVDFGSGNAGSRLGQLLNRKRAMADKKVLKLTLREHGEYIRGLHDGGVLYAQELYTLLEKSSSVDVSEIEVEDK